MSNNVVLNHADFIRESYTLARKAVEHGNHPFGALLVKDSTVVLTAENSIHSDNDITRHAELNLVSQASQQFQPEFLAQCTLYTSTEPCPMCAGAIYYAGVTVIAYGCSANSLAMVTGGKPLISCRELLGNARQPIQVIGPILEEEGIEIHRRYWR